MDEVTPVLWDYLLDFVAKVGGSDMAKDVVRLNPTYDGADETFRKMSAATRRETAATTPIWWRYPTEATLDRATAGLPRLLNERLEELGLDYAVMYPSEGVWIPSALPREVSLVVTRALNTLFAEMFRPYAKTLTMSAYIPMFTPKDAIAELEYCVRTLGAKVVMTAGPVRRPIPAVHRTNPELDKYAYTIDTFGIDSEYDYNPVWEKCLELKVAPTFHTNGMGWGSRQSPTNVIYNHIGHFAAGCEPICKSLFLSGVTRRYPQLRIAFLECGVDWASRLYADLVGRWKRRGAEGIQHLNPERLDVEYIMKLMQEYGDARVTSSLAKVREFYSKKPPRPSELDDMAACRIQKAEDIADLFIPHFYFGCEADDPFVSLAFNTKINPFGAKLRPMLGSDIGHWDSFDMRDVLPEAQELLDHELLDEHDFKEFVFSNAVKLHGGTNPDFYKGTSVEQEAQKVLQQDAPKRRQPISAKR